MRIGFDIDGVLADFCTAYETLIVKQTKRNDFPKWTRDEGPVTWNWPEHFGYSKEEVGAAWKHIKNSHLFWHDLEALPEAYHFYEWLLDKGPLHELYFVTARPGLMVKAQTEQWFKRYFNEFVTVLISDQKGAIANALSLDYYVDDKLENIESVQLLSPGTQAFLIDRAYNRKREVNHRISDLETFLSHL